jgi:glutamine synthetase
MSDIQKVMNMIKEHDVKYVDFRFTDPRGKWQHLAHHIRTVTEEFLAGGVMFDGSSIAGWKAINESDMILMPDCATAVLDPFAAQTSLIIFCDTHEPLTASLMAATRAPSPRRRSSTSPPPASATRPISAPKPSSSSSTTSATRPA